MATTDEGSEGVAPPAGTGKQPELHHLLARLEHLLDPTRAVQAVQEAVVPGWQRVTEGESRLAVTIAVAVAIALMAALPSRVANHPQWLLPGLALALLIGLVAANPRRIDRPSRWLRVASLLLIGVISLGNAASAARLVIDLAQSEGIRTPSTLLLTGAAIWLTNMIAFALWYWEFDNGGPVARALTPPTHPDFEFPQMTNPELARPGWKPEFVDYLYLSFTNATAFSPTDAMPMSRWAKLTMLVQAAVSLTVVILVIARAVNVLK